MPNALSRLVEDRRAKLAREMSHLNSRGQGESIDTMRANAIARLKAAPGQAAQGMFTGIAGAPVDIANMALRPFGLGSENPVGGSNSLAKMINADTQSTPYQVGTMLPISPTDVAQGLPLMAGIFAGRGAKTANLSALVKAEEMAKAGIPDAQIWKETGWTLNTPDKMPRFEIPDNRMMYRGTQNGSYADQVIHHPELFGAYPQLGGGRIREVAGTGGSYADHPMGGMGTIELGTDGFVADTAAHELQHAIQSREGFARGGSPEMFNQAGDAELAKDALSWKQELLRKRAEMPNADWIAVENAAVQDYQKMGMMDMLPSREARDLARQPAVLHPDKYPNQTDLQDLEGLVSMYGLDKRTSPAKPVDLYNRLAGEAEARLTQSRMNLTPEQRLAQYPYEPQYFEQATGVPLSSLIVRKEGGNAMSIPENENAMTRLIREAQAQIDAENAAKNLIRYQPESHRVRNALIGLGAGGAGVAGGYYGADYLSR